MKQRRRKQVSYTLAPYKKDNHTNKLIFVQHFLKNERLAPLGSEQGVKSSRRLKVAAQKMVKFSFLCTDWRWHAAFKN